jgi:hypothetical protein
MPSAARQLQTSAEWGIGAINTTRDGLVTNDGRYNNSNGMYSAIFTSPDMVEEVRVSSNNVDPTLGRGGAQGADADPFRNE